MTEFKFPKIFQSPAVASAHSSSGSVKTVCSDQTAERVWTPSNARMTRAPGSIASKFNLRISREYEHSQALSRRLLSNPRLREAFSRVTQEIIGSSAQNLAPAAWGFGANPDPGYHKDLSLGAFDLEKFHSNLVANINKLSPSASYAFVITNNGAFHSDARNGKARRKDAPVERDMTIDQPINIGSISKIITSAAVLKAIENQSLGLDLDDPIFQFFPEHWGQAAEEFQYITIRHCLTYKVGGLNIQNGGASYGVAAIKSMYKLGGSGSFFLDHTKLGGSRQYNNMSFAWFRIALFYMTASTDDRQALLKLLKFAKTLGFTTDEDQDYLANAFASYYYAEWVRNNILLPIGCFKGVDMNPTSRHNPGPVNGEDVQTYYYNGAKPDAKGGPCWNWALFGGGGGWVLPPRDLARFFAHLKHQKILGPGMTKEIFNYDSPGNSMSLFSRQDEHGVHFNKNGVAGEDIAHYQSYVWDFAVGAQLSLLFNADYLADPDNDVIWPAYTDAWK